MRGETPKPNPENPEEGFLEKYRFMKEWIEDMFSIELTPIEATRLKYIIEAVQEQQVEQERTNINDFMRVGGPQEIVARFLSQCYGVSVDVYSRIVEQGWSHEQLGAWFRKLQRERHHEDGFADEEYSDEVLRGWRKDKTK